MRALMSAAVLLWASAPVGAAPDPLIGAWRLVQVDEPGPTGAIVRRTDLVGSLVYTADGRMSVQIAYPAWAG